MMPMAWYGDGMIDGSRKHFAGSCAVWEDPLRHAEVTVLDSITLDANEALVVYREDRLTPSENRTLAEEATYASEKKRNPSATASSSPSSSGAPAAAVAPVKQDNKRAKLSESGTLVTR